jgi:predicted nucleotidyltransferase component of viral defense system
MTTWHPNVIGARQKSALAKLGPILRSHGAYLAGGTALALQLGHRRSVDLDFFVSSSRFDFAALERELTASLPFRSLGSEDKALHGKLHGVRVLVMKYEYLRLRPVRRCGLFGCDLAALEDIGTMKLAAICHRRTKKDFVDLWALLKSGKSLNRLFRDFQEKFHVHDLAVVTRRLIYTDDVDDSRMPSMLWKTRWTTIKSDLRDRVDELRWK